MSQPLNESEFRSKAQATFETIYQTLDPFDPDPLECDLGQGTLTLKTPQGHPIILSTQPSLRQLWLANANEGKAHHFNYAPTSSEPQPNENTIPSKMNKTTPLHLKHWIDEKSPHCDLSTLLNEMLKKTCNITPF